MNPTLDWRYDAAEHERQQLARDVQLSFAQKLQWLEDAHRMVIEMQKTRPPINSKGEYFPATSDASTREEVETA